MQAVIPGQANTVKADLVSRSAGAPITAGTVTFYLVALNGPHAGKWFRAGDNTWQATESSAGDGTHLADGHWLCTIAAAAWAYGVMYLLYAKESGDAHTAYCEQIVTFCVCHLTNNVPYILELEDGKSRQTKPHQILALTFDEIVATYA